MLQQTRVETVVRYYDRFLHRFPSLDALATAGHDEVLKRWEGLGYYRRVLHLHRAARILHLHGSGVPATAKELLRLPGVGEYTAAAVASIAYGEQAAAVDGNVSRVLARLFGIRADIRSKAGKERVRVLAASLLHARRPGDFNQAWMDLGATICVPRSPDCPRCPLMSFCVAAGDGRTRHFPVRGKRKAKTTTPLSLAVGVFVDGARMLVRRRPRGGLWSGLWEFPNVELNGRMPRSRAVRRLAQEWGVQVLGRLSRARTVRRELTHRSLTFLVYVVRADPHRHLTEPRSTRWVSSRDFGRLSVSTAHRHIFAVAREALADLS